MEERVNDLLPLAALVMPPRVAGLLRRLGAHQWRQQLHQQQAPEILKNLKQVAKIESTESSNHPEGVVAANDKRLRELIAARAEPADRTEGEIAGYRDVLDTIHQNHAHIFSLAETPPTFLLTAHSALLFSSPDLRLFNTAFTRLSANKIKSLKLNPADARKVLA
jgi:hypothetical protein